MNNSRTTWNHMDTLFTQLYTTKLEDVKQLVFALPTDARMFLNNACVPITDGLYTFCRLEKGYAALQFLSSKSFFSRKEDYVTSYRALQIGFEEVADVASSEEPSQEYRLAMHLGAICSVRCFLVQLSELDIIANLLQAQLYTADLHFLDSLLCFTTVSEGLSFAAKAYKAEIQTFKSGKSKTPSLLSWLNSFYDTLLAKYTLYWFHILSQSVSNSTEVLEVVNLEDPSLVNKILDFQTQSNALYVSLFFDTGCQKYPFLGHGYVLRGTVGDGPKGVHSIPPIFTAPLGQKLPAVDLYAIVMQITGGLNLGEPEEFNKLLYSFDEKLNHTYFIRKLECRVFLAMVYDGCRTQRDRQITEFMSSFANLIRLQTLCVQLNSN